MSHLGAAVLAPGFSFHLCPLGEEGAGDLRGGRVWHLQWPPRACDKSCWGYLGLDLQDRNQTVLGKVTLTSAGGTGELGPQGLKDVQVPARLLGWRVSLAEPGVWPCPLCLALCQVMLGAREESARVMTGGSREGCLEERMLTRGLKDDKDVARRRGRQGFQVAGAARIATAW